jgi:hypothetical protein
MAGEASAAKHRLAEPASPSRSLCAPGSMKEGGLNAYKERNRAFFSSRTTNEPDKRCAWRSSR